MTAGVDSQWDNALFLFRVTEEHSLMYEGVGNFGESVQSFAENLGHSIPEQVERTLGDKIGSAVQGKKFLMPANQVTFLKV